MARFRATIEGQRGSYASRLGTPKSGIRAHVCGWSSGVEVEARADGDADVFTITATRGSHNPRGRVLGEVRIVEGQPVFVDLRQAEAKS